MNEHTQLRNVLAVTALALAMAGCASQGPKVNLFCTAAGALVGGGGVAAIGASGGAAAAGVAVGAALGAIACPEEAPAPTPMPMAAAPAPAPEPVPEPDSDGDGVKDSMDQCPDTPKGEMVDANGCPPILLTLTGVNFRFDSAELEPAAEGILDQAVEALNKARSVTVRIEGHADSTGPEAYNLKLSERRAESVQAYLVAHGIAASRMTTAGRGESMPVASNDTKEGRRMNRRAEFHVEGVAPMSSGGAGESWRRLDQPITRY